MIGQGLVVAVGIATALEGAAMTLAPGVTSGTCIGSVQLPLRIAVSAIGPTAIRLREDVLAEVAAIWPRQGVSVERVELGSEEGAADAHALHVIVRDGLLVPARGSMAPTLAAIAFVDDKPANTVIVSTGSVAEVLRRWVWGRVILGPTSMDLARLPILERQIARLTGWAVAHEIGHYVLASRDHDAAGLMRPSFNPHEVPRADPSSVTLASQSAARLAARRGTCSSDQSAISPPLGKE